MAEMIMQEEPEKNQSNPVATSVGASGNNSFVKRELNGATFLTLEHVGHMVLVVVVSLLVAAGITAALAMWTNETGMAASLMEGMALGHNYATVMWALGITSSLLLLTPLMVVLDRRTRAEWRKRPGYTTRLAYKLPIYGALGVVVALKAFFVICMLTVVLTSLAMLGIKGTDFGNLYMDQFVPAFVYAVALTIPGWYLFKLAKGRDFGKLFSMGKLVVSVAVILALFCTALMQLREEPATQDLPGAPDYSDYLQDLERNNDQLKDMFDY